MESERRDRKDSIHESQGRNGGGCCRHHVRWADGVFWGNVGALGNRIVRKPRKDAGLVPRKKQAKSVYFAEATD